MWGGWFSPRGSLPFAICGFQLVFPPPRSFCFVFDYDFSGLSHDVSFSLQDFDLYLRRRARRPPVSIAGFDPVAAARRYSARAPSWVDLLGAPSSPPLLNRLPHPDLVLAGSVAPNFADLRLRDPDSFRCGNLHEFAHQWDSFMTGLKGYDIVRPWLHHGVHLPGFFRPFKGEFNGRVFDSAVPPSMFFQNDSRCLDFLDFISSTILKRLEEGSVVYLGRVGVDPPPRVVNALSVEPTKPRLILSMRAVNLFCKDTDFSLVPLADIVRHVPDNGFFSGFDDCQGYKQLSLTKESYEFCGFEWAGFWFADTTLPFGWKNSAYVYFSVGEVLSEWLRSRGIHTELWIDDRFLGLAP